MPENQIPATQTESGAVAGELNFIQPEVETPRIRRRSLKTKPQGLIKPAAGSTPPAARELEREAPPLSAEQVLKSPTDGVGETASKPAPKATETPVTPPKTTPSASTTTTARPATASTPTSATSSPHGTRPATLYYSSTPRKEETPAPMKTIPSATTASSSSSTAASTPVTRVPATATSRPSPNIDYRANVERQSREQKSVGNILAYVVYALIAFFVISAGLAAYGADVIFKQLHDQSVTVADLDARYAAANKDVNMKLAATQDTLSQAQAQIARQQDLIVKQQEELNRLIAVTSDNDSAIRQEKEIRAEEEASLRARVKDLEFRTSIQKY